MLSGLFPAGAEAGGSDAVMSSGAAVGSRAAPGEVRDGRVLPGLLGARLGHAQQHQATSARAIQSNRIRAAVCPKVPRRPVFIDMGISLSDYSVKWIWLLMWSWQKQWYPAQREQ